MACVANEMNRNWCPVDKTYINCFVTIKKKKKEREISVKKALDLFYGIWS